MKDQILDSILGSPDSHEIPFDSLMPRRVNHLLLVTSLYDCYTFIEDGRLSEMLFSEYMELNLRFAPSIERVSTADEALQRIRSESFDLVISMPHVGEMNVRDFGKAVKEIAPDLPLVLLAINARELSQLAPIEDLPGIDRVFVWLGDVRLFLAIIKYIEDRENASHDARMAGVKSILLIEDSIQFYSSFLPILYTEIMNQTQMLINEGINRMQKMMRMRARPKILLATSYEEAADLYDRYRGDLLGVIADALFPKGGILDRSAGLEFAKMLKCQAPQLPVVIQSDSQSREAAGSIGVEFIDKNSPSLLGDLRIFMKDHLGFGDFVFRNPDGTVVSRASHLRNLQWAIEAVPDESLAYHSRRNDISIWLMARSEFELAEAVRHITEESPDNPKRVRVRLLEAMSAHREQSRAGVVAEFSARTFEAKNAFVRIGSGSLGGKGRGLAFANSLFHTYNLTDHFPQVRMFVPPTAVLGTGVFDQFMESSRLMAMAMSETDDEKITAAFLDAPLPHEIVDELWNFLDWVRYPLAVRSSSLLEDASYQPFAGIYQTYMIPNNDPNPEVRLEELCNTIKMVYASTYHADAKAYIESTANRLEEEKMAVIIQQVVGRRHGSYLYPDVAGVARSINFYPMPGMIPEDGVASVVLGLGKAVVDGGLCVRFSPAHPRKPMQFLTTEDYLDYSPRTFIALDLSARGLDPSSPLRQVGLSQLDLKAAEQHGTLAPVASYYSPDNDVIYDGVSRKGVPLVTMAGILKQGIFPLADVLSLLLKVGSAASSCPVEIEFALNLSTDPGVSHEFAFLQIRPLVFGSDSQDISIEQTDPEDAISVSHQVLGNGLIEGICDLIYVRQDSFNRGKTSLIAREIETMNTRLKHENRPYLLIGNGRWGSADPWLGIPVRWSQIAGARCIIETDLKDMHVDPSQGSHFFHNIMSFGISYMTVISSKGDIVDFDWLDARPAVHETEYVRHLAFDSNLQIALNGRRDYGVVVKPGRGSTT